MKKAAGGLLLDDYFPYSLLGLLMRFFSLFGLTALLLLCHVSNVASTTGRDMEREAGIWSELESIAPDAVPLFKDATIAGDSGNTTVAMALYRKVLDKAPGFDPAQRRLGLDLLQTGAVSEAYTLLDSAVEKNRSPENLFSLAYMLAFHGNGYEDGEVTSDARALSLAREAVLDIKYKDVSYPALYAQCALQADNEAELRNAVGLLQDSYPSELSTHYFSAILAAVDHEWSTAHDEIMLAVDKGLDPNTAATFLDESGVGMRVAAWKYFSYFLYALAAWGAGLLFLFTAGRICSSMILRFIENGDPNAMADAREKRLRRFYKKLITITGVYYYVSLPIVAVSVLLLAAGVTFASFAIGRLPIYWLIVLDFGALVTVYYMVRTLFTKPQMDDPGRALLPEEAPELWALTREVAATIGTRPIDEIRVVPGTELAVYERGSSRERAEDRACRILILGVGVLENFSKNGFRAVLAHEYGHFAHRDTAGGEVAMRVNQNMHHLLIAMARGGQITWWNLGAWFLRLYIVLFHRISHGATRLQEVMADRVAVLHYGSVAFRDGLTHVITREAEFKVLALREVNSAHQQQRPLLNVYELQFREDDTDERQVADKHIHEALSAKTSEDDSHPAPLDRFRLADRVQSISVDPLPGDVWSLIPARDQLTREMNRQLRENANASGSVLIPVEA